MLGLRRRRRRPLARADRGVGVREVRAGYGRGSRECALGALVLVLGCLLVARVWTTRVVVFVWWFGVRYSTPIIRQWSRRRGLSLRGRYRSRFQAAVYRCWRAVLMR